MFGFVGKLIALPIRIVNAPVRALEDICEVDENDRIMSKPLDLLADEIEEATEDD